MRHYSKGVCGLGRHIPLLDFMISSGQGGRGLGRNTTSDEQPNPPKGPSRETTASFLALKSILFSRSVVSRRLCQHVPE